MSGTLIVERARQAISRLSDADAPWPAVAGEMMTRLRRVVGFGAFRAAQNDPRAPMPAAALADNDAVDADGDPELLWALRGGGAFGVVTSLTLAVHPVPDVRTAAVMLPVDRARDGLVAYRETCAGADGRAGLPGPGPGQRRRPRPGRRRRRPRRCGRERPRLWMIALQPGGGAMARIPAEATAFPRRHASHHIHVQGLAPPADPGGEHTAWVRPHITGGMYANVATPGEGVDLAAAVYRRNQGRLAALKVELDPANRFPFTPLTAGSPARRVGGAVPFLAAGRLP